MNFERHGGVKSVIKIGHRQYVGNSQTIFCNNLKFTFKFCLHRLSSPTHLLNISDKIKLLSLERLENKFEMSIIFQHTLYRDNMWLVLPFWIFPNTPPPPPPPPPVVTRFQLLSPLGSQLVSD